jgi:predicted DNA-binding transcriptional regulator AlpA
MQTKDANTVLHVRPASPIRLPQVRKLTGDISRATIWRWVKNDPSFPKPFRLSSAITCWDEGEIRDWVESKKAQRRSAR